MPRMGRDKWCPLYGFPRQRAPRPPQTMDSAKFGMPYLPKTAHLPLPRPPPSTNTLATIFPIHIGIQCTVWRKKLASYEREKRARPPGSLGAAPWPQPKMHSCSRHHFSSILNTLADLSNLSYTTESTLSRPKRFRPIGSFVATARKVRSRTIPPPRAKAGPEVQNRDLSPVLSCEPNLLKLCRHNLMVAIHMHAKFQKIRVTWRGGIGRCNPDRPRST